MHFGDMDMSVLVPLLTCRPSHKYHKQCAMISTNCSPFLNAYPRASAARRSFPGRIRLRLNLPVRSVPENGNISNSNISEHSGCRAKIYGIEPARTPTE